MKRTKAIDCLRMKDEIQARLAREHRSLTDAQVRRRVLCRLAVSRSTAARLWRSLETVESESSRRT